jgi:myo-inositol-1(or 4)-monophosphatase
MSLRSPHITVMIKAAKKAAGQLRRDFGEVENLQVSKKGPADFVSTADMKAEKTIREELARARPGYGFLMEESGAREAAKGETRRWLVDPLDGTTNFLHGLPHFAVSIALEERGQVIAGVVYDPIKDELFAAERGQGAFLNDRRLRVSSRDRLDEALVGTGIPFKGTPGHRQFLAELEAVMAAVPGVRRWGTASLDLAYVAAGRFDAYWERNLNPWDIAAGVLLVREAGGLVTEVGLRSHTLDSPSILAVTPKLPEPLDRLLSGATA